MGLRTRAGRTGSRPIGRFDRHRSQMPPSSIDGRPGIELQWLEARRISSHPHPPGCIAHSGNGINRVA